MKSIMKNIETFLGKYLPMSQSSKGWDLVQQQIEYSIGSPEHPIYHPEKTLDAHIDIVVGRCLEYDSKELHFVGMFHDITKSGYCPALWDGRVGEMKHTENGSYWQNTEHNLQAADFIAIPEVTEIFKICGVNVDLVSEMVKQHMKMKLFLYGEMGEDGMNKKNRRKFAAKYAADFELMRIFSGYCDNMLKPVKP